MTDSETIPMPSRLRTRLHTLIVASHTYAPVGQQLASLGGTTPMLLKPFCCMSLSLLMHPLDEKFLESGACSLERALHDATSIFIELLVLVVVIKVCPMFAVVLGDGSGVCLTYVRRQVQR